MTEKPILFSAPMVRAILAGRKTMTRRLLRFPPWTLENGEPTATVLHNLQHVGGVAYYAEGVPRKTMTLRWAKGDRLWVREMWFDYAEHDEHDRVVYRATDTPPPYMEPMKWRPSIYMPRWASRLTLEVTAVRVERLQDITNDDARAEGVEESGTDELGDYRTSFRELWDVINGKRAEWASNPWVAVVSFKRLENERM